VRMRYNVLKIGSEVVQLPCLIHTDRFWIRQYAVKVIRSIYMIRNLAFHLIAFSACSP